jgi:hypothetical protein
MRVHDRVVLDEIELYGELIIAASGSEGPLSEDEIDAILGINRDDAVLADAAATSATGTACAASTVRSSRATRTASAHGRQRSAS